MAKVTQAQRVYLQAGVGIGKSNQSIFDQRAAFHLEPAYEISKRSRVIFHFSGMTGQTQSFFYPEVYKYNYYPYGGVPTDTFYNVSKSSKHRVQLYQLRFQYKLITGPNWSIYTTPGLGATVYRNQVDYSPDPYPYDSKVNKSYFTMSNELGFEWQMNPVWHLNVGLDFNYAVSKFRGNYDPAYPGYTTPLMETKDFRSLRLKAGLGFLLYTYKP